MELPFGSAANSSSVSVGSVQVAVRKYLVAMRFENQINPPAFKEMCKGLDAPFLSPPAISHQPSVQGAAPRAAPLGEVSWGLFLWA